MADRHNAESHTPGAGPADATGEQVGGERLPLQENVWVVVPAYNESARLAVTLRALCRHYDHVVVVDDGSVDDTFEIAREFPVWLLRHALNCGQGAALQTGIDFATGRGAHVLVTFDADGQHCVEDIERLVDALRGGSYDVALGSRFLGATIQMPWTRWLTLKVGVLFTRILSGMHVTDTHNGMRAFTRRAAEKIRIHEHGMAHASEILHNVRCRGLRFCEVPVTIRYDQDTLAKGQNSANAVRIVSRFVLGRIVGRIVR